MVYLAGLIQVHLLAMPVPASPAPGATAGPSQERAKWSLKLWRWLLHAREGLWWASSRQHSHVVESGRPVGALATARLSIGREEPKDPGGLLLLLSPAFQPV